MTPWAEPVVTGLNCSVCGAVVNIATPLSFVCPNSRADDRHHVLQFISDVVPFRPFEDLNPFIAFRHYLGVDAFGAAVGLSDKDREQIIRELNFKKETIPDFPSSLIMGYAELDGVVCNGNMKGRQITYSLLEEKVPKTKTKLTKEEGLAQLAKRYFESHGPATLPDFIWWCGFPATVAKLAVLSVDSELDTV